MKNLLTSLIILAFIFATSSQAQVMSGFDGTRFFANETIYQNKIKILEKVYGYKQVSTKRLKRYPQIEQQMIKLEERNGTEYKLYLSAPSKTGKRILVAGATVYKIKKRSEACKKFNEVFKRLKGKYDWKSIEFGINSQCQKKVDYYEPRFNAFTNGYESYYKKTFTTDANHKTHLTVYKSKKGSWFVREFYHEANFKPVFSDYYKI